MGLVFGVDFGSESGGFAIHCDSEQVRILVADKAQNCCGEDISCLCRLAGRAGQPLTHRCIVGGVDVGVTVDYVKRFCH